MSFGEPDQKKVDDVDATNLKETWFYLKNGHRWVVRFENGKVVRPRCSETDRVARALCPRLTTSAVPEDGSDLDQKN